MSENTKLDPFNKAPKDVKKIIVKVIELERDKLNLANPRLGSEVVDIVKSIVTEKDLDQNDSNENGEMSW